ncbi:MAG: hypothetical protein OXB98_05990 [Bryobacterales bacterium]|nr:hypothetical protein [Bryobacterales bacterium]
MPQTNGEDAEQHTVFDYALMDFMSILAAGLARSQLKLSGVLGQLPVSTIDEEVDRYLQDSSKHPAVRDAVRSFHRNLKIQVGHYVDELKKG